MAGSQNRSPLINCEIPAERRVIAGACLSFPAADADRAVLVHKKVVRIIRPAEHRSHRMHEQKDPRKFYLEEHVYTVERLVQAVELCTQSRVGMVAVKRVRKQVEEHGVLVAVQM